MVQWRLQYFERYGNGGTSNDWGDFHESSGNDHVNDGNDDKSKESVWCSMSPIILRLLEIILAMMAKVENDDNDDKK